MKFLFINFLLVAALVLPAAADQVELTDGSLLKGRIVSVDAGKIKIETAFVGTVSIPLASVARFATDDAVHVGLADGPTMLTRVEPAPLGVRLVGDGVVTAAARVNVLWRQGAENPVERLMREAAEKARRKWSFEATAAVTGRTGTSDKINATAGFKATLASDRDRLILASTTERAQDNGVQTANRQFLGADYSSFYSPDHGWYVRSTLESDKIKALDLRSTTALGFTRKLIRKGPQDLEFRSGASYVYENYSTGKKFNSPGFDFTLLNTYNFHDAKFATTLAYVPAIRDFSNYRLRHESALELPLTASLWKLKLGVANDYQGIPPAGVARFNTTYFTSLLLNWK